MIKIMNITFDLFYFDSIKEHVWTLSFYAYQLIICILLGLFNEIK